MKNNRGLLSSIFSKNGKRIQLVSGELITKFKRNCHFEAFRVVFGKKWKTIGVYFLTFFSRMLLSKDMIFKLAFSQSNIFKINFSFLGQRIAFKITCHAPEHFSLPYPPFKRTVITNSIFWSFPLDYSSKNSVSKSIQAEAFKRQLVFAVKYKLPFVLHVR